MDASDHKGLKSETIDNNKLEVSWTMKPSTTRVRCAGRQRVFNDPGRNRSKVEWLEMLVIVSVRGTNCRVECTGRESQIFRCQGAFEDI